MKKLLLGLTLVLMLILPTNINALEENYNTTYYENGYYYEISISVTIQLHVQQKKAVKQFIVKTQQVKQCGHLLLKEHLHITEALLVVHLLVHQLQ